MQCHTLQRKRSRTKIIATVGPACRTCEQMAELVLAGVDVFRLNMAHASRDEHTDAAQDIRQVSRTLGMPIAVLADLAGPKIRLGELPGDALECDAARNTASCTATNRTPPTTWSRPTSR